MLALDERPVEDCELCSAVHHQQTQEKKGKRFRLLWQHSVGRFSSFFIEANRLSRDEWIVSSCLPGVGVYLLVQNLLINQLAERSSSSSSCQLNQEMDHRIRAYTMRRHEFSFIIFPFLDLIYWKLSSIKDRKWNFKTTSRWDQWKEKVKENDLGERFSFFIFFWNRDRRSAVGHAIPKTENEGKLSIAQILYFHSLISFSFL